MDKIMSSEELQKRIRKRIKNKIAESIQNIERIANKIGGEDEIFIKDNLKEICFFVEVLDGYRFNE